MKTLTGRFLIATPNMTDTRFAQTVAYICEHTEQGAMALIINRPAAIKFSEIADSMEIAINNPDADNILVVDGGPVQPAMGCVIHPYGETWRSTFNINNICVTTSKDILHAIAENNFRTPAIITLGYTGWAAKQLEQELAQAQWLTCQANSEIVFDVAPEQRWQAALAILGVTPLNLNPQVGHA